MSRDFANEGAGKNAREWEFAEEWSRHLDSIRAHIECFFVHRGKSFQPSDVENLCQETILRYCRSRRDNERIIDNQRAFLLKIAKNCCLNFVRDTYREQQKNVVLPDSEDLNHENSLRSTSLTQRDLASFVSRDGLPEETVLANERQAKIDRAIEQLPPRYQAIVRFYLDGATEPQICQWTGEPRTTIKKRIRQGQKRLQELLNDLSKEE